jgi:hypothetical protein
MNPEILDFIQKLLELIPVAIQVGGDVLSIIKNGQAALLAMRTENRGPTEAEWSNLNATIDGYMAQLKDSAA